MQAFGGKNAGGSSSSSSSLGAEGPCLDIINNNLEMVISAPPPGIPQSDVWLHGGKMAMPLFACSNVNQVDPDETGEFHGDSEGEHPFDHDAVGWTVKRCWRCLVELKSSSWQLSEK